MITSGSEVGTAPAKARGRRASALVLVALGVATVLLGGFGVWATVAAHSSRAAAVNANVALADRSATSAVERAVAGAVETIFSYSYADTGKTRAAAQGLLTGAAIRQYDQLFALVERQALKEKLVFRTKVTNVGVELLSGGRARLLVFANQQDSRVGTSQATYGGAMFAVTAVRRDGRWLIENIDTFTSGT